MARPKSKPRKSQTPRTFSEAVQRFNREKNAATAHGFIAEALRARLRTEAGGADAATTDELAFHLSEILEDVLRFVRDADLPRGRRSRVVSLAEAIEIHWPYHERSITRLLTGLEHEAEPGDNR